MSGDSKLIIGVIVGSVILLIGAIILLSGSGNIPKSEESSAKVEIKIRDDSYNVKGSETPEVVIVEFSDFECGACGATAPILKQIMNEYQNNVRFVYQHFPLPQHKFAELAAESAEAVGAQGKFWEMHDLLFANQTELSAEKIRELGGQIEGLDVKKFNQDLDDKVYRTKVLRDLAEAKRLGVNSTPTIYINGIKYEGKRSFQGFKEVIDKDLLMIPNEVKTTATEEKKEATDSAGK